MLIWILLAVGVGSIYFVLKMSHWKHKIGLTAVILFLLILSLTFVKVASSNSVELGSPSGIFSAVKFYFSWLGHVFDNAKVRKLILSVINAICITAYTVSD